MNGNEFLSYVFSDICFVCYIRKSFSKFSGNGVESLNGKTSPSKPLLSRTASFGLSEKYLSVEISHLL